VFRIDDAVVVVCEHCNTVNARTDRGFEDLGKVADLVDTPSPLALWVEGRFRGVGFMIVGRSQFRHPAGGLWDEWYLKLDDGSWGWLAEAQGRFYITFPLAEPGKVPPLSAMVPGERIHAGGGELVVAEAGEAEEGLGLGSAGLAEARYLDDAAREQRRLGVVPELESIGDPSGDRDHILERSAELGTLRIAVGVDAEAIVREGELHAACELGVRARHDDRRGQAAGHLLGVAGSGEHAQGS